MNRVKQLPLWSIYALLAYMPFHVFLAQSVSLVTGGLSMWKIAKDVIIAALAVGLVLYVWRKGLHQGTKFNWAIAAAGAYVIIHLGLYAIFRDTPLDVALLATIYNVRPILLLIIGLSVALILGKKLVLNKVIKFALIISTVVSMIGVVQYFLPYDLLTHFGYSEARGAKPSFLIDNKADLPRIMSTLREPNSLGAFLVVPILLLTHKFLAGRRKLLIGGLLLLHGLALLLTFSRSAWLALVLSEAIFLLAMYRGWVVAFCKRHVVWVVAVLLLLSVGVFALRDQYFIQNTLFHSDENTVAEMDSNEKHFASTEQGINAIADQPQGYGPGTAGPVSMHTDKPFITENYYVQLGYELGMLGLLLFLSVCVVVFLELKKIGTPEAKILYSAFIGYALCNLLLHTWANEAVATQWWLLAGLLLGMTTKGAILRAKKRLKE